MFAEVAAEVAAAAEAEEYLAKLEEASEREMTILHQVGFQAEESDFLLKNVEFPLKNVEFIIKMQLEESEWIAREGDIRQEQERCGIPLLTDLKCHY